MSFDERPELSVVVPVYNEEGNLLSFLEAMARQRELHLEVIISDGGSSDGGIGVARGFAADAPFAVTIIEGAKGRGAQLNLGADAARAPLLLFLHVDSRFDDPLALRKAVDALEKARREDRRVAGRFSLRFDFEGAAPLPYRFYGAKATLDRPGCTHGDQGFMMGSDFFNELGAFQSALPLMEDTFLAERVREKGSWILFPARIATSSRRFLTEGLLPRQSLNAILMNLATLGHLSLIESLRESYRSHDAAKRLELRPILHPLNLKMAQLPRRERWRLWYRTGSYVRSNAWQIAFFLDVVTGGAGEGKGGRFLSLHDRLLGRLIDNRAGNCAAALFTWFWFRTTLRLCR
uniref:Glycosyl transferase family 2 n=1 Tax=Geobacter sp. (strain M21) TaxID=443144 RepID=C6E0V7_GEOSM